MKRYVALGSSMAAGPGIRPRAAGSPLRAGRSARNYPHLVAERAGLDLIDVTYSGATTANILREPQHGTPPQIDALDAKIACAKKVKEAFDGVQVFDAPDSPPPASATGVS